MSAEGPRLLLGSAGDAGAASAGWRAFALPAAAALALRLLLAPWMKHGVDVGTFMAWAHRLAAVGPGQFWSGDYWCDYLPGYLYVLWGLGAITAGWPEPVQVLCFKLPNIAADVVTAYLIWTLVRPAARDAEKVGAGLGLPAMYLFNPAILGNSTLWGQVDSFHAMCLVGALHLLSRRRLVWAAALLGYAAAVKPHTVVILPLVGLHAVCMWRSRGGPHGGPDVDAVGAGVAWRRIALCVLIAVVVFAATFVPFAGTAGELPEFIRARVETTMGEYGKASVNAMNLWYLLGQNWRSDGVRLIGGWTTRQIGSGLCIAGIALALGWYLVRQRRIGVLALWESAGLIFLVTFLFATRAHERHVFPFFAAALVAAGAHRATLAPYAIVSATYVINLGLSWAYLLPGRQAAELCDPALGALVCVLNLLALPLTAASFTRWGAAKFARVVAPPNDGAMTDGAVRRARWWLAAIVLFALGSRVGRLNAPPERFFDEVYHAYTAEQWLHGNTEAWLWSAKAPEKGCSYEWTHPPLAKLLMEGSMALFGAKPWAWRLPAALLGTGCVVLVYGLARTLFARDDIALLAAALMALDALPLTMSRIGMNDIYCVAFMLAAVLAAVRGRYVLAPLAIGAALACKWTGLFALPLLALIHQWRASAAERWHPARLATLVVLYGVMVPGVYFGSYLPFFRSGRPVADFVELQKQMWHYHSGLKATHPFSSQAWQWPLDSGTVWCYTRRDPPEPSAVGEVGAPSATEPVGEGATDGESVGVAATVANVYATGHPLIWLPGLAAVGYALVQVRRRRDDCVAIVIIGYFAFWAPWLASPRIMFLYHYLPALPFLYIILAWTVVRLRIPRKSAALYLGLCAATLALMYPYLTAVPMPEALTPSHWGQ